MLSMNRIIIAIMCLVTINTASTALGDQLLTYEYSAPGAGAEYTYRNLTTGVTVSQRFIESATRFKQAYVLNNAKEKAQYLFCKYCGSTANEIDLASYQFLFPLEVGKSVEFARWKKEDPERSWTHTIMVGEIKQVATQVSEIPVNVFVLNEKIKHNSKSWEGNVTYWFSPELNANVNIIDDADDELDKLTITQLVKIANP